MKLQTDIYVGDAIARLRELPDGVAQCVVTSPPYYRLRDYKVKGQIGQEDTVEKFVARLVEVFDEVWRVMRDDGTLWLNLGDTYGEAGQRLGIPPRVVLALQEVGWTWRDEIVWHKPRTTPFPAKNRTVANHEMVYLLTKQASGYYFNWKALEEPAAYPNQKKRGATAFRDKSGDPNKPTDTRVITTGDTRRARSVWSINPEPYGGTHFATMPLELARRCVVAGTPPKSERARGSPAPLVLDPFGGNGTTAIAAMRQSCNAALIELNPEYARDAAARWRSQNFDNTLYNNYRLWIHPQKIARRKGE